MNSIVDPIAKLILPVATFIEKKSPFAKEEPEVEKIADSEDKEEEEEEEESLLEKAKFFSYTGLPPIAIFILLVVTCIFFSTHIGDVKVTMRMHQANITRLEEEVASLRASNSISTHQLRSTTIQTSTSHKKYLDIEKTLSLSTPTTLVLTSDLKFEAVEPDHPCFFSFNFEFNGKLISNNYLIDVAQNPNIALSQVYHSQEANQAIVKIVATPMSASPQCSLVLSTWNVRVQKLASSDLTENM